MTTAFGEQHVELADVRLVRRAARRLRVVGGSGPVHWARPRLWLGMALAGAMIGALFNIVQSVLLLDRPPVEALQSYVFGAAVGAGIGLLVAMVLGLVIGLFDRYLLPQQVQARPVWVRYRRDR